VRPVRNCQIGGDGRFHLLVVLDGFVHLPDSWSMGPIGPGGCVLLPACLAGQTITADDGTRLLRVSIP
jgi:hypothetical protein